MRMIDLVLLEENLATKNDFSPGTICQESGLGRFLPGSPTVEAVKHADDLIAPMHLRRAV